MKLYKIYINDILLAISDKEENIKRCIEERGITNNLSITELEGSRELIESFLVSNSEYELGESQNISFLVNTVEENAIIKELSEDYRKTMKVIDNYREMRDNDTRQDMYDVYNKVISALYEKARIDKEYLDEGVADIITNCDTDGCLYNVLVQQYLYIVASKIDSSKLKNDISSFFLNN